MHIVFFHGVQMNAFFCLFSGLLNLEFPFFFQSFLHTVVYYDISD